MNIDFYIQQPCKILILILIIYIFSGSFYKSYHLKMMFFFFPIHVPFLLFIPAARTECGVSQTDDCRPPPLISGLQREAVITSLFCIICYRLQVNLDPVKEVSFYPKLAVNFSYEFFSIMVLRSIWSFFCFHLKVHMAFLLDYINLVNKSLIFLY